MFENLIKALFFRAENKAFSELQNIPQALTTLPSLAFRMLKLSQGKMRSSELSYVNRPIYNEIVCYDGGTLKCNRKIILLPDR